MGSDLQLFAGGRYEPGRAYDYDLETDLYFRPDTVDLTILRGDARRYARRLPPEPGDGVLDVGAHIGGATRAFLDAGAALVIAVEPDPANFGLLRKNTKNRSVWPLRAAVVGDETKADSVTFFRGSKRGTSMGGLAPRVHSRSIRVPAVRFRDLLRDHRITYVKLDCEGSEHDLLATPLPPTVRRLIVEFHTEHPAHAARWQDSVATLDDQGFVPDQDPNAPTKKAWVWTVAYRRRDDL